MAGVAPMAGVCLIAVFACASVGRPVRPPGLELDYARAEALAEVQQALREFDRNLSSLSGDFENFEETTRYELEIRRERLREMQQYLRQLSGELEVVPDEDWRVIEAEAARTIQEMDRIFEEINSLLGPGDISDTLVWLDHNGADKRPGC